MNVITKDNIGCALSTEALAQIKEGALELSRYVGLGIKLE